MTEAYLDELLDEFVPPQLPVADWQDVLGRARRDRRRLALTVAALAALAIVPTALAFGGRLTDWFQGKPAPTGIRQNFVRFNIDAQRRVAYEAKAGLLRTAPLAIPARAHGVLALKTADGLVYLWAAPRRGGGICWLVQLVAARKWTSGSCDEGWPLPQRLSFGTFGTIAYPSEQFILGRALVGAASVEVAFSNGEKTKLPVVEGLFIGAYPKQVQPLELDSYDTAGAAVARLGTLAGGTAALPPAELQALSRMSARGTPYPLPQHNPFVHSLIAKGYKPTALLLATRANRNYFQLPLTNGQSAFGTGRVGLPSDITKIVRAGTPAFPSLDNPILDISTTAARDHGGIRFLHVGGIAADGVARIVVKDREGRGLLWLPVRDNIYDSGTTPVPAGATHLDAQDVKGRTVATVPR